MRHRYLILGGLAVLVLAAAAFPIDERVLVLPASGDPADHETITPVRSAEQRITLPTAHTVRAVEFVLLSPVPRGTLEFQLEPPSAVRSSTVTLAKVRSDGRLRILVDPLVASQSEPLAVRVIAKDVAGEVKFRTATGITENMAGPVRIGNASRDRSLALTVIAESTLGGRALAFLRPSLQKLHAAATPLTTGLTFLGAAAGILVWNLLRRPVSPGRFRAFLITAAILSLFLHEPFRLAYPATNDEGSILADAQNLWPEFWPPQTGGAKGSLALVALAPVVRATEDPLRAGRGIVTLLAALEAILLGILARQLWDARTGVLAALLYAVTPAVLAQTTQVFLQPFALPFVTIAGILLMLSREKNAVRRRILNNTLAAFLAGVAFALAFLARPTSLAFVLPAVLLTLATLREPWPTRFRHAGLIASGFLAALALAGAIALPALGFAKTADLFGWQGFLVSQHRADLGLSASGLTALGNLPRSQVELDAVLQRAWPLLAGALPLLLLSAAGLFQNAATLLRLPKAATVALSGLAAVAFLMLLLRQPALAEPPVLYVMLVGGSVLAFLLAMVTPRTAGRTRAFAARDLVLFAATWALLAVGYANYGRFRAHYHAEFLPLYVFVSAVVLAAAFRDPHTAEEKNGRVLSRWARAFLVVLVGIVLALSFPFTLAHHHAGNIPLPVVDRVIAALRERTEPGDEIFTGQVLFPVLAGGQMPFGIAHPGWYREESLGLLPAGLRAQYYPDRATLRAYVDSTPVRLVVIERRTREVFLEFDPKLRELIRSKYALIQTFSNPLLDSIELWERIIP